MAATLRINGRDYSPYLKLYTEDQVGVVDAERIAPQFAGNAALSEGQVWIGSSTTNKHWQVAMIVRGASLTVDSVNQMVRDIRGDLYRGAVVEYAPDGASQTTFFELEAGEFRPNYNHPRYRHGYVEGVLELWTRPYGSTGTTRLVASRAATCALTFDATGVLGDVDAAVNVRFGFPAGYGASDAEDAGLLAVQTARTAIGYGVKYPGASFEAVRPAASMTPLGLATKIGASGLIGSQYIFGGSPTSNPTAIYGPSAIARDVIPGTMDYAGRYRVLVIYKTQYDTETVGVSAAGSQVLTGLMQRGDATIPIGTAAISGGGGNTTQLWGLADLGEMTCLPSVATQYVEIGAAARGMVSANIGTGFGINALIYVPVDRSAGIAAPAQFVGAPPAGNARDSVHFDSYPSAHVYRMASDGAYLHRELSDVARGGAPRLPAQGSPGASGAARVVAFAMHTRDVFNHSGTVRGARNFDVSISARERFSFYR